MRKAGLFSLIISVFITIIVASQGFADSVFVDTVSVHTYQGRKGQWIRIDNSRALNYQMSKYGTTLQQVQELNGSFSYGTHVFIPYSEEFLSSIIEKDVLEALDVSADQFIWPIAKNVTVSSAFGLRLGRLHTGIDIPARRGAPIVAAMDGKVISSGYGSGHGRSILLEHRDGYLTRYSHCSTLLVKKGDYVKKGQILGLVGSTGNSTGNHLHFEIRYGSVPLNPLDFLPEKENVEKVHMMGVRRRD